VAPGSVAGFNKWAKCVRAMATGADAVTPAEAGRRIAAMPEYRGKLSAGELAAIGDAVRGIELEMGRDVVLWSIKRPWLAGKGR
jgi:hypothetical protein